MEQYFLVAVKAIVPLFLLILTGTYIRWRKLLTDTEIRHVNGMVFEIFFFCMMFHNLYITSLDQAVRPKLILFSVAFWAICSIVPPIFSITSLFLRDDDFNSSVSSTFTRSMLSALPMT